LIGELAGVAHLRADALRGLSEPLGGLGEGGRGALGSAGAPVERAGALADGGQRRSRCFGTAGDRTCRPLELADHRAQFEVQELEDFPGGIALRASGNFGSRDRLRRLRFDRGRSRLLHSLSKQTERHGPLGGDAKSNRASSHHLVKSWLTIASYSGRRHYCHTEMGPQSLISVILRTIRPRFHPSLLDDSKRPRMAGHSQFKYIMHRKGRQDAQKSKLFGKLAREITVAAKLGTPDPGMNPRLRAAI